MDSGGGLRKLSFWLSKPWMNGGCKLAMLKELRKCVLAVSAECFGSSGSHLAGYACYLLASAPIVALLEASLSFLTFPAGLETRICTQ